MAYVKNTFTTRKKRGTWRHLTLGMLCRQLSAHMLSTRLAQPSHKDLGTEHCRMTKRKEEKKQLETATNHSFTQATWMLVGGEGGACTLGSWEVRGAGHRQLTELKPWERAHSLSYYKVSAAKHSFLCIQWTESRGRERMIKWNPTKGNRGRLGAKQSAVRLWLQLWNSNSFWSVV